jgi:hypothetical protein
VERLENNEEVTTVVFDGPLDVTGVAIQLFRFFNNEFYYTETELAYLMAGLESSSTKQRLAFFSETIRLRRRERHLWRDCPLARVFTDKADWHMLRVKALVQQLETSIKRKKHLDARAVLRSADTVNSGVLTYEQLRTALEAMRLGFSPRDVSDLISLADTSQNGRVVIEEVFETLQIPEYKEAKVEAVVDEVKQTTWTCASCTYTNSVFENSCSMCDFGWDGERQVPQGKWACMSCSFYNDDADFYCSMCDTSRPDLAASQL